MWRQIQWKLLLIHNDFNVNTLNELEISNNLILA